MCRVVEQACPDLWGMRDGTFVNVAVRGNVAEGDGGGEGSRDEGAMDDACKHWRALSGLITL